MEQIRYKQRNCEDSEKIERFLTETRVGVIGLSTKEYSYAVPVNYVWHDKAVYFHGMGSGKKVDLLMQSPAVCFTVFQEYGTVMDPVPCHADTSYMSVMLFGKACPVIDHEEGAQALQKIIDKYMPNFYKSKMSAALVEKYKSSHDQMPVAVFKLVPDAITAKENAAAPEALFPQGHPH